MEHIVTLFYDGKQSFIIDQNGILKEKELLNSLVKKGYKYIKTNCIGEKYKYSETPTSKNQFSLEDAHNVSIRNFEPLKNPEMITFEKQNKQNRCAPVALAVASSIISNDYTMDLQTLCTNFNTEKILMKYSEQNPDKIERRTSIYSVTEEVNELRVSFKEEKINQNSTHKNPNKKEQNSKFCNIL